jgi:transposase
MELRVVATVREEHVGPVAGSSAFAAHEGDRLDEWQELGVVMAVGAGEQTSEGDAVGVGNYMMFGACLASVDRARADSVCKQPVRRLAVTTEPLDDEPWRLIEPLLPRVQRRSRHPGRRRIDDRRGLNGIMFVLSTGIAWQRLPQELGFGSGMTCWRRLRDWQQAGVWQRLHELLLARLRAGRPT